jgi:hypothetical protein
VPWVSCVAPPRWAVTDSCGRGPSSRGLRALLQRPYVPRAAHVTSIAQRVVQPTEESALVPPAGTAPQAKATSYSIDEELAPGAAHAAPPC